MKIYQVGGAVRDKIMGRDYTDIDYVVEGADIEEMIAKGYKKVGKNFPVFIGKDGAEYALCRREKKVGNKHGDFIFEFSPDISIKDDSNRRDFTCNALIFDEENNRIIDYHNGIKDIKNKILRHINAKHFVEDPLRVLRMCRFGAQLDFEVAEETLELAKNMVSSGMLKYLSAERVWQEIFKALKSDNFEKFIMLAKKCGALKEILPEIDKLFEIPERTDFHPEGNSGKHTILCLKQVKTAKEIIKFGVLMHDVGKGQTPKEILPHHHGHDDRGAIMLKEIAKRIKCPKKFENFAFICCKKHMKLRLIDEMRVAKLWDYISYFIKSNIDVAKDFVIVCRADFFGRDRIIPENEIKEFEDKAEKFLYLVKEMQKVKATEMKDFITIKNNDNFGEIYYNYRLQKLKELRQNYKCE